MAARVCSSTYSSVHCQTFPTISMTPKGLAPLGCASTLLAGGSVRPLSGVGAGASFGSFSQGQANGPPLVTGASQSQLPHGKMRPSFPCAAYCHSHSCGSRFAAHLAYSRASSIETHVTGLFAHPSG